MQDFHELQVWQKSHQLTLEVYRITKGFPPDERFGLTNQIRRSSVSIGSNIAEGCGRGSNADFNRFCQMAMGSACELEYQLLLAGELNYLSDEEHGNLSASVVEIKKMLSSFMRRLVS
ncbi:four helix bundle protein [Calycomorphotria hydatis]|uniref:four helix bundle protein n=1 Tax=Calycomorphotria hydatis TaxID=2528027 RepID=UPI0011A2E1D6